MAKSLLIYSPYHTPHQGGLETHVDEFSKFLTRYTDRKVVIFTSNIPESDEIEIRHGKVKVIRYPAIEIVANFPIPQVWHPRFWKLLGALYKSDFEIIMTRTRFFISSLMGAVHAKLKSIPHIHVEHGSSYVELNSKIKNAIAYIYDRTFGLLIFKLATKTIAISETSQHFIKKHFLPNQSIPIIKRGIDFEFYKKNIHSNYTFPIKPITIGYLGRLFKWKGVENTIIAFRSLPTELREKANLIIGGYGEDEERLKKLAGQLLDKSIFFTGKVSFKESVGLYNLFDIYVHSSSPGGALSSSLLQAMYLDCAVIASPYEGASEAINKSNGILLKSNNYREIKNSLIKLLLADKKTISNYKKAAHEYVKKEFSWKKTIMLYLQQFKEINEK